jgi:hypothetical protein
VADVFISYSKQDPEHTRALARELQRRGYSVWYDTDGLAPGDDFQREIELAIEAAKAVIVIWTNKSKESEWVRFEAMTAYAHRKLITTHAEGIDFVNLPVPFNRLHSERCDNIEKICSALRKLNIVPSAHQPPADDKAAPRPAGFFDWVASRDGAAGKGNDDKTGHESNALRSYSNYRRSAEAGGGQAARAGDAIADRAPSYAGPRAPISPSDPAPPHNSDASDAERESLAWLRLFEEDARRERSASSPPSIDDYERELAAFRSAADSKLSRFFLPEDEPWNKQAPRSEGDAPRYSRHDYHQLPRPPFEEKGPPHFLQPPQHDDYEDFFVEEEDLEPDRRPEPPRRRVTVMDSVKRLFGKKDD